MRSLRHSAASNRSKGSSAKTRATASLTVKEQIARRSAKPLIQGRQFKWISPAQKMKEMNVDMARVRDRRDMLEGDDAAGVDETHSLFAHALTTSALLNLSLPFIAFSRSIEPKARSLPLVIHHRQAIVAAICSTLRGKKNDVELCGEQVLEYVPSTRSEGGTKLTFRPPQPPPTPPHRPLEPPPPLPSPPPHHSHHPHRPLLPRLRQSQASSTSLRRSGSALPGSRARYPCFERGGRHGGCLGGRAEGTGSFGAGGSCCCERDGG